MARGDFLFLFSKFRYLPYNIHMLNINIPSFIVREWHKRDETCRL